MKTPRLLFAFVLLLASVSAFAQWDDDKLYMSKDFSETYLQGLTVKTSGGAISVEGNRSSGVRVEMYVRGNNWNGRSISDDEIEERLRDYTLVVRREGNTVVASAEPKNRGSFNWKSGLSISFRVFTPQKFTTNLVTSGGSIRLASLTGDQTFTTSGGSIKVQELRGNIQGRTSGGSIEAIDCADEVDLVTSGGSIKAEGMTGMIRLKTSGGSISLARLDGTIEARTSGGGIRADRVRGELDASTSGGSIRMQNLAASVRARTSAGSIEADFDSLGEFVTLSTSAGSVRVSMPLDKGLNLDLRGNKVSIPLRNFTGQQDKDRVEGSMNGGGIPIKLTASSGSVYVNQ